MNMIELPPLAANQKTNLIMRSVDDEVKKDTLMVRMNGYQKLGGNFDSSASSTSRSHSSNGLLVKRSKTSNNLGQEGKLGPLMEQNKNNSSNNKSPSMRRTSQRTLTQKYSSEYGGSTTTATRTRYSNAANNGSLIASTKRCVSSNDLTKMDGNNNTTRPGLITRVGLSRNYKSEQKLNPLGKDLESKSEKKKKDDVGESDEARQKRILDWLNGVEYAEPPPELPEDLYEDRQPTQTDTAIHVVYGSDR